MRRRDSLFAVPEGNEPEKYSDWQVVGPSGGDVRAVAVDPKDKNRVLSVLISIHTPSI